MEPSKNKPAQQDDNPMADYNPKDRNFQNTDDAPVASNQQEEEEEDEFDDYDEEMDELEDDEEEDEDETKDQTV
jgi:hypothetical protein